MDFTYEPGSWDFKSADHCQDQIPILSMVGKGLAGDSYKVTMEENDDGTWVLRGWKRTGNSGTWILDWETNPMYQGDIWSTSYISYRIAKALGVDPDFIKRLLAERDYKEDTFGDNADGSPRDTKEYIDDMDDEVLDDANGYTDARETAIRQWANLTFALIGHLHDDRYSQLGHNHDGRYSQIGHTHDDRYYTETEADGRFAAKSHTHDDRYYTESEVNNLLAGKSNTGHTHDDRYYTETEVNNLLASYLKKADFGTFFNQFYQDPTHAASSYNMGGAGVKSFLEGLGFTYINQSEVSGIQARVEWHRYAPLFVVKFNGVVPASTNFRDRSGGMTQNTDTATEITMYKLPTWATPDFQWEVPCVGGTMYLHVAGKDSGSEAGQVRLVSTGGAIAGKNISCALSFYCQTPPTNAS